MKLSKSASRVLFAQAHVSSQQLAVLELPKNLPGILYGFHIKVCGGILCYLLREVKGLCSLLKAYSELGRGGVKKYASC